MRRVIRLIIAAFLLTGWLLAAASLHVLILPGWNFGLVPKDHLGFTDTYVDARNWTPADAALHPALVKRLIEAGRADWLSSIAGTPGESLDAKLKELLTAPAAEEKPKAKKK
ncbi:MAG: hypothetical protein JWM57_1318 [Phycisphaerales bacterium]|nr:hypothetical protein [Phycisphaerales bacterium]